MVGTSHLPEFPINMGKEFSSLSPKVESNDHLAICTEDEIGWWRIIGAEINSRS
jgi:hypothetical protein